MQYVFVPLILAVLVALFWSWWAARSARDPASSVDSFNRALSAMQPGSPTRDRGAPDAPEAHDDAGAHAGDVTSDA